jgi:hypothetical protein
MPARSITATSNKHGTFMAQQFMLDQLARFEQRQPDGALIINSMLTDKNRQHHDIYTAIQRYKPKHIVMIEWNEPHWYSDHLKIVDSIIKPSGVPYTLFGQYADGENVKYFNFFILVFDNFRPEYNDQDLLPQAPSKLFLNYNRSPRPHRTNLVNQFEQCNLLGHGHVSHVPFGGGTAMLINEQLSNFDELFPSKDATSTDALFDVPNDPFSLGDLNIWRDHIVHVVSDGLWVEKPNRLGGFMLCEKHWKPILGLRPFLVNGSYDGYLKLKELGIDVFEDQFPGDRSTINACHATITNALQKLAVLTQDQRLDWYNSLMPRLIANQQRYFELVAEAKHELETFVCPL